MDIKPDVMTSGVLGTVHNIAIGKLSEAAAW